MNKSWLGIDAKVHEAILYLQDYAAAVLTSLKEQQELNKRLNEENVALMRKKEA